MKQLNNLREQLDNYYAPNPQHVRLFLALYTIGAAIVYWLLYLRGN